MKGGLCCALFAAKALRDAGVHLNGRLIVESVIGEEDGGVGTLAAILRGYTADGAIIDPCEEGMMNTLLSARAVLGLDEYGMDYITAFREGQLGE